MSRLMLWEARHVAGLTYLQQAETKTETETETENNLIRRPKPPTKIHIQQA